MRPLSRVESGAGRAMDGLGASSVSRVSCVCVCRVAMEYGGLCRPQGSPLFAVRQGAEGRHDETNTLDRLMYMHMQVRKRSKTDTVVCPKARVLDARVALAPERLHVQPQYQ